MPPSSYFFEEDLKLRVIGRQGTGQDSWPHENRNERKDLLRKTNKKLLVEGNIGYKKQIYKDLKQRTKKQRGGGELCPPFEVLDRVLLYSYTKHLVGEDAEASGEYGIGGRHLKKSFG
jgi:hypothetical protein